MNWQRVWRSLRAEFGRSPMAKLGVVLNLAVFLMEIIAP
jgi:hypothetical protein